MIIDAHTHIYRDGDKNFTAKDLLFSMDEAGIDYSLLIADGAVGGSTTEQVIQICKENSRLKAIGCLQFAQLDNNQIEILVSYLKSEKIHGIKLYPPYETFYPQDERLFPLYDQCQNLGKPVIIHTGMMMPGLPGLLKHSHPLNLDEVATAFPHLKIIMAHFGNPWITDAMMVLLKNRNVYIDVSGYFEVYKPINPEVVTFFLHDLTYLRNYLGSFKRLLFGTDWPLYSQKEYLSAVGKLPLSEEEKELVLWKNAKNLFGLEI